MENLPQTTGKDNLPSLGNSLGLTVLQHLTTVPEIVFNKDLHPVRKLPAQQIDSFLMEQILGICAFLSVPMMSALQIQETVRLIRKDKDFMEYRPEDFVLCFDRGKVGKYGKNYNRIDGQIILEWLGKYDYERQAEIEAHHIQTKQKVDDGVVASSDEKFNPEISKKMLELAATLSNPKPKEKKELTLDQKKALWAKNFDAIRYLQNQKEMVVQIGEVVMDLDTYMQYKLNQSEKPTDETQGKD